MGEFKNKLAKLIDLKSIITILMVSGLIAGWFLNKVTAEQFIPLVTMILTFYFAKKENTGGQV
jgi:hypothetical protein